MKKTLLLSCIALGMAGQAAYAIETFDVPTAGTNTVYTFESLSKIEGSGVTAEGNGTYSVINNITLGESDTLRIDNGITVKLGNTVLIKLLGHGDFAPADTATITVNASDATPKGFQFYAEKSSANIKHIHFNVAAVKYGGAAPLTVENCTFEYTNNKLASAGSLTFAATNNGMNVIRNCRFLNTVSAAVAGGANLANGLLLENNYMENCVTYNGNRPFINLTVAADQDIIIRNNTLVGHKLKRPGGITVSNTLGMLGSNNVLIENNDIRDCRYGINVQGHMNARIINNTLVNNHWEDNAANGGSGISINSSNAQYYCDAYVTGNHIEGSLWGVTIIGTAQANFGKTADPSAADYNPGNNTFVNNGNCGTTPSGGDSAFDPSTPYDLYNNTANTVYAQNNTWNVPEQTSQMIETVIYHKNDKSTLGEVIFMPAKESTAINNVENTSTTVQIKAIAPGTIQITGTADNDRVEIYNICGSIIYSGSDKTINVGTKGIHLVRVAGHTAKVIL